LVFFAFVFGACNRGDWGSGVFRPVSDVMQGEGGYHEQWLSLARGALRSSHDGSSGGLGLRVEGRRRVRRFRVFG
jgi:hypothetical protein